MPAKTHDHLQRTAEHNQLGMVQHTTSSRASVEKVGLVLLFICPCNALYALDGDGLDTLHSVADFGMGGIEIGDGGYLAYGSVE